jgi:hypothetical protein
MKKILVYCLLFTFTFLNVFTSCDSDKIEKQKEREKKSKVYLTEYRVHSKVDSAYTGISVYVGEVDGHKMKYTLYSGKNKSQMDVEHVVSECKKCLK